MSESFFWEHLRRRREVPVHGTPKDDEVARLARAQRQSRMVRSKSTGRSWPLRSSADQRKVRRQHDVRQGYPQAGVACMITNGLGGSQLTMSLRRKCHHAAMVSANA
jgi:hypothetical protein